VPKSHGLTVPKNSAGELTFLFIADPLDGFKTYKDTTFAMMREAQRRGHVIYACGLQDLAANPNTALIEATAQRIVLTGKKHSWYAKQGTPVRMGLNRFSGVLMRKDPPFDVEFFYATHMLSRAESQGARVFNRGQALRDHPEKLAILEFPQFTAPTLVTRSMERLRAFHDEHDDVIYKPLDGMGGMGIFRAGHAEPNLSVILEMLTDGGTRNIMAQKYLPAIVDGDKRILIVDGKPVPWCLARIPKRGETRGNLAAGSTGVARELTPRDREIAETLGPVLAARGLFLIGLDVIGEHVTEINVTSPTCFQEISAQSGIDVAALFVDALERHVRDASAGWPKLAGATGSSVAVE
jgi:glutathione synthase